jgi:hypothetical protein
MADDQAVVIVTVFMMLIASVLLAIGTNGFVGGSLFFAILAIDGVIQLKR